jgi:hypothetical protein
MSSQSTVSGEDIEIYTNAVNCYFQNIFHSEDQLQIIVNNILKFPEEERAAQILCVYDLAKGYLRQRQIATTYAGMDPDDEENMTEELRETNDEEKHNFSSFLLFQKV